MAQFFIEAPRWAGMRYSNGTQEAPDADAAIAQFLAERVDPERVTLLMYPIEDGAVPRDCNVVYRVDADREVLVAAFGVTFSPIDPVEG